MAKRRGFNRPTSMAFVLQVLVSFALAGASAAVQVGTVQSEQKISETAGGFGGVLDPSDLFGVSVAALGDLDGDGNRELAVGTYLDDDGEANQGAVWILFLNADGTVASEQKISETEGGFGGILELSDFFGISVAALGDLDGDGNEDLAVGSYQDDDGGSEQGAVWILFLDADGTVASEQKISETEGGFGGVLDPSDVFGGSLTALGSHLVAGAYQDDDGGTDQGAVWILSFAPPEVALVGHWNGDGCNCDWWNVVPSPTTGPTCPPATLSGATYAGYSAVLGNPWSPQIQINGANCAGHGHGASGPISFNSGRAASTVPASRPRSAGG